VTAILWGTSAFLVYEQHSGVRSNPRKACAGPLRADIGKGGAPERILGFEGFAAWRLELNRRVLCSRRIGHRRAVPLREKHQSALIEKRRSELNFLAAQQRLTETGAAGRILALVPDNLVGAFQLPRSASGEILAQVRRLTERRTLCLLRTAPLFE
jgi:hypothetical protein